MNWIDEQIRERKLNDDEIFAESLAQMAGAVLGKRLYTAMNDDSIIAKDAIEEIMRYYHIKCDEVPSEITDIQDQLEYLMRPHGIMRRQVNLEKGWQKDAFGAMLGTRTDDGSAVALIPTGLNGYKFYDRTTEKYVKVTSKNAELIDVSAIAFYIPFPLRKIGIKDILLYMLNTVSKADIMLVVMATLILTLVGMLMPKINNLLFGEVIEHGNVLLWAAIGIFLICVTIGTTLFSSINNLLNSRIGIKMDTYVDAAAMMRVLSLPASFFKNYSAGELSNIVGYISQLSSSLRNLVLSMGLTSVFSLIYIGQIFSYAPGMVIPSIILIIITVVFSVASSFAQIKIAKQRMEYSAQEAGLSYSLISGIQKIKLSGSEKRAFAKWGKVYSKSAKLIYNPPMFIKINAIITLAISLLGNVAMYYFALKSKVSVSDYYAFSVAYGMVFGAFASLAGIALTIAQIKPIFEMARPILDAEPEVSENKKIVTKLGGGIELNHVSFRYNDSMPNVVDDLSLKIKPGQYVAIVGKTGCGKSTLVRLLLGFEKPNKGAIYYDGKDLNTLELRSLRKHIGCVIQNGKLFQGDIYSNIVISAPWLSLDDAWEAAETAGIADDIQNMPMGMNTIISEGSGGISGGQRQRLMIARAIAPKPKILIFDEATSALDNISQKKISEALDNLKCTRIVIAHRLSTIKQCDRILVLDDGHIIEDGTYDELIAQDGFFAELVKRQTV